MKRLWPFIFLSLIVVIFFSKLFFPHLSIFVTPDLGQSDLLHAYYPLKFTLATYLQNNQLPFWISSEATGYPLFADGQIGALYIPDLILYKFLPFFWAVNVSYIFSFCLATWGAYLLARKFQINTLASIFAGVTFGLSGFMLTQLVHISLLQSSALLPLELLLAIKLTQKFKLRDLVIFSLIISQQIFVGHQQMTAYSVFSIFFFVTIYDYVYFPKKFFQRYWKHFLLLTSGVIFAIALSAILLVPSAELYLQSRTFAGQSTPVSYPVSQLLTFFQPFLLGSPVNGTSHFTSGNHWEIFWENTGYIGFLPLGLTLFGLFWLRRDKNIAVMVVSLIGSLLLIFGSNSPFVHWFFEFPPLNLFRVSSRFLVLTDLVFAILGARVLQELTSKKIVFGAFIIIQFLNIYFYFGSYHPVGDPTKWFESPAIANYLNLDPTRPRILPINNSQSWNSIFLKEGWQNPEKYMSFANNLMNHSPLMWGLDRGDNFVLFPSSRMQMITQLLYSDMAFASESSEFKIGSLSARMLNINSIKYLIVPENDKNSIPFPKIKDFSGYAIYENSYNLDRFRIVFDYQLAPAASISAYLASPDYNPGSSAILEENIGEGVKCFKVENCVGKVSEIWDRNTSLILNTTTNHAGLLILSDSVYPGWHAYIDDQQVKIYAANINSRAVILPEGVHSIRFEYRPLSIIVGGIVTGLALISALVLISL